MQGFIAHGAVGCVVNHRDDLSADPQVAHNGCLVDIAQPGCGPVRVARHPIRFSATPAAACPAPAPDPLSAPA
jgi:crotonobetainyl-CoA:carnitine CoA-transferase CaiB-like acyl-CoA transferase